MKISIKQVGNGYIISDDEWASKDRVYNTIEEVLTDILKTFGIYKNLVLSG